MNGRHHVIANVSTVITIDTVLKILSRASDNDIYSKCHNFVLSQSNIEPELQLSSIAVNIGMAVVCIVLFVIGSLLPDIDQESSTLGKIIYIPVQHRTWTHTFWIIAFLAVLSVSVSCLMWLCLGYLLHLFYDSLSKGGICWFYPLSQYKTWTSGAQIKKNHKIYLYRTGETSELIITMLAAFVGASMLVYNIYLTVGPS